MTELSEILTAAIAGNDARFLDVLELYVPRHGYILDMTFGRGVFWRLVEDRYAVTRNDACPEVEADCHYDFTDLPDNWTGMFDAVVLDPPYKLSGTMAAEDQYHNKSGQYNTVTDLYETGIKSAFRVLVDRGVLIVKSQDQVVSGKRKPISYIIFNQAMCAGFFYVDTLIKVNEIARPQPHKRRVHASSNHSIFQIFRKMKVRPKKGFST